MRASSLAVLLGMTAIGMVCVAACVGDTPTTTSNPGDEGQPCFSNGTCNAGLTCLSSVCVRVDAGNDSGSPAVDGGPDGLPPPCPFTGSGSNGTTMDCPPSACTLGSQMPSCCQSVSGSGCTASTTCAGPNQYRWDCDNPSQCSGAACCAGLPPPSSAGCPKTTTVTMGGAQCAATCTKGLELCSTDNDCTDKSRHCTTVEVTVGTSTKKLVGACL